MSSDASEGSAAPEGLGEKATKFLGSLTDADKLTWSSLTASQKEWLASYLDCYPGPDREVLLGISAPVRGFRVIAWRIIEDKDSLFFKGVKLKYSQLRAFQKALRAYEYEETKLEASRPVEDANEEDLPKPKPIPKRNWGKLAPEQDYGKLKPPTGISANQSRTLVAEVRMLLAELEPALVAVASTEADLKELMNAMDATSKAFKSAASKLLQIAPSEPTMRWIEFRSPSVAEKLRTALHGRRFADSVVADFDKLVLGFKNFGP